MHAGRTRFSRSDARRAFGDGRVPTAGFAQRNRKDRAISVNHIESEQDRDLQSRLFHCSALKLVRPRDAAYVERRTKQAFAHEIKMLGPKISIRFAIELLKLPKFFFERHAGNQRVDFPFEIS